MIVAVLFIFDFDFYFYAYLHRLTKLRDSRCVVGVLTFSNSYGTRFLDVMGIDYMLILLRNGSSL